MWVRRWLVEPIWATALSIIDECVDDTVEDRDLASLVFIAGYVAHKLLKKMPCQLCQLEFCTDKELLCEFGDGLVESFRYIGILNRGGLKWPTQFLTDIVVNVFVLFNRLISASYEQKFLTLFNQKQVLT